MKKRSKNTRSDTSSDDDDLLAKLQEAAVTADSVLTGARLEQEKVRLVSNLLYAKLMGGVAVGSYWQCTSGGGDGAQNVWMGSKLAGRPSVHASGSAFCRVNAASFARMST